MGQRHIQAIQKSPHMSSRHKKCSTSLETGEEKRGVFGFIHVINKVVRLVADRAGEKKLTTVLRMEIENVCVHINKIYPHIVLKTHIFFVPAILRLHPRKANPLKKICYMNNKRKSVDSDGILRSSEKLCCRYSYCNGMIFKIYHEGEKKTKLQNSTH